MTFAYNDKKYSQLNRKNLRITFYLRSYIKKERFNLTKLRFALGRFS